MPVYIEGEKHYMRDLKGTDIKAVSDFMKKNKSKASIMIYVDSDGGVNVQSLYQTKKTWNILCDWLGLAGMKLLFKRCELCHRVFDKACSCKTNELIKSKFNL